MYFTHLLLSFVLLQCVGLYEIFENFADKLLVGRPPTYTYARKILVSIVNVFFLQLATSGVYF